MTEPAWFPRPNLAPALGALDPIVAAGGIGATPGLGAWTFYYKYGWKPTTDRQRAGLRAVKQALIDNGFGKGIDIDMEIFGDAARARTKEFQGAGADGVVGPITMRKLLRVYVSDAEIAHGIPDHLLGRLCTGESNNDPIAEGVVDRDDEGVLQFHLPYWPGVTEAQAWVPTFEIAKAAEKFADLRAWTHSWKGAVAAWNIGTTYARMWVDAGYPASGGPVMGTDPAGNPIDSYVRATNYWAYIDGLPY